MVNGARLFITLLVTSVLLLTNQTCLAHETATIITLTHKYENVEYFLKVVEGKHCLIIYSDDNKIKVPIENARLVIDASGANVTNQIIESSSFLDENKQSEQNPNDPYGLGLPVYLLPAVALKLGANFGGGDRR